LSHGQAASKRMSVPDEPNDPIDKPVETVTLGVGSQMSWFENECGQVSSQRPQLLPVPAEVVADIARQESAHPMTPEYRKLLCDWLTLAHYFADIDVAFRRTPAGVELLAAGLDEIAAFLQTSTPDSRQDVVFGVG
jgi:hypothetical protein